MKKLLTKIVLLSAIICVSCFLANAQSNEKYTYRDLLTQQKIEREELKQTHKETLDKIIGRQKEEFDAIPKDDNGYERGVTRERHNKEREKIVQLQKEEREKQMQFQADEKKNFKEL
jgi:hypothetical protein